MTRPYINYCKGSQILINGQSLYSENFVTNSSTGLQRLLAQIESRDYSALPCSSYNEFWVCQHRPWRIQSNLLYHRWHSHYHRANDATKSHHL